MSPFHKDKTVLLDGIEMRILRHLGACEVQLENVKSGEIKTYRLEELLKHYCDGTLLYTERRRIRRQKEAPADRGQICTAHLSPAALHGSRRRMDYIQNLKGQGSFGKPRPQVKEDIATICARRGEPVAPSMSTVYRWYKQYLDAEKDVRALFCRFDRRGGKGSTRLHPDVEAIVHDKIETVFLAGPARSAEEVHNAVVATVARENATRVGSDQLNAPGLRTLQRRLNNHYAYDVTVAKYGELEANRRFSLQRAARSVQRILEIVEIDHSPVDILVTDERGIVIGRPTITVILDRHSRCVLGFFLSLAGTGTHAVFSALRHALLPKTYLRGRYADLELEWDCFGWPEVILMDNGREFHASSVADALMNLSIATEFARSKTPNDKPHVERFLRTFNYSFIHRLPGTTLANVHERKGRKLEAEACLTLEVLDRLIHVWICQNYHLRPHRGLNGRSPMAVWRESAAACPPQLKANSAELDIEFAQFASSALQHYGIDLNTFEYTSTRLLMLRRMLPIGARVDVKWPSGDAGHIFVWDPIDEEYFKVMNKDEQYIGLTVEQAKVAKKAKADAEPTSQLAIASGQAVVREMVDRQMRDKALKVRKSGARLGNQTSDRHREQPSEDLAAADIDEPLDLPALGEMPQQPDIDLNWSASNT